MKIPISLVVISLNEESNIARCLRSVPWAEDVVVVDSGSQDRTTEIIQSLGGRVIHEKWRGYGPMKAFAVQQAKTDWVLCLDADEALSSSLAQEISEKWKQLDPHVGYEIPRKSFYLGRWILHGGWYPDEQLRLFNRRYSNWDEAAIHEKVQASKTEKLVFPIEHYVFKDIADQVATNNRYSSLQAEKAIKDGVKACGLRLVFKPISKFFECYIWKLGFLDGLPGFIIAVGAAYSVFLRWAKVWEMTRLKNEDS